MILEGFRAEADIWGGRTVLRWSFALTPAETLGDLPRVAIRRKKRDFEFPAPPAGQPDPFLIFDSAAFPPPGAQVRLLPDEEKITAVGRDLAETETVTSNGKEILRRTRLTHFENDNAVRVEFTVVDAAPELVPLVTYYYELRGDGGALGNPARAVSTAMVTRTYDLGRKLFEMTPEIYRRYDVIPHPRFGDADRLPEEAEPGGQLRRMMDLFGRSLDFLRTQAEGLRLLHDIDNTDAQWLPLLARWVGWELSFGSSIPIKRHEVRYAPALYRLTGTIPGCMIWVRRLTGWNSRIKEFGANVFFTNDLGNPDDPTDHGSRTVDPDNAAAMAAIGTIDDDLDYTYDPRLTDDAWYAYNTIGVFLQPPAGTGPAEVKRTREKLKRNLSILLPVNVRGVVILNVPRDATATGGSVDLLDTEVN